MYIPRGSAQYRKIAEKALGKPLPPGCEVHHINRDRATNAKPILVICQDKDYHTFIEARGRKAGIKPPVDACGKAWPRLSKKASAKFNRYQRERRLAIKNGTWVCKGE